MNTDITKQMEMVLYRTEDDNVTVSALIKDETIWITQKSKEHQKGNPELADKKNVQKEVTFDFDLDLDFDDEMPIE